MMRTMRAIAPVLLALLFTTPAWSQYDDDPFGDLFGEESGDGEAAADAGPLEQAAELAREGRYGEAELVLKALLAEDPDREEALLLRARVGLATGHPEQAAAAAARLRELQPDQPPAHLLRGILAERRGDVAAAREAYERAVGLARGEQGEVTIESRVRLGLLLAEVDGELAGPTLERALTYYQRHDELSAAEFTWIARACDALDREPAIKSQYAKSMTDYARRMLDQALAADPDYAPAHVLAGQQALAKLNTPLANKSFRRAVEINPNDAQARVGLATAAVESFYGGAGKYDAAAEQLTKALSADPTCAEAHALLARMDVTDGNLTQALERLETALEATPGDVSLLAVEAAVWLLRGKQAEFAKVEQKVLAARPRCARFYVEIADLIQLKFRYAEARDLARKALEIDPGYHPALAVLGVNLTRTAAEAEGRKVLERAFESDPYNVFLFNHLQLWDRLDDQYVLKEAPGFRLRLHTSEQDVTARYMTALCAEAKAKLSAKYGPWPDSVLVELFPKHDDFSARSVGLPGIPALGVCFGNVVTVLSSKEKKAAGTHAWGRTLWHELTHVATLTRTGNRVPRWLTEGLSVYEESRGRPTWRREYDQDLMVLLAHDLMLPIARLDEGFTKPRYPNQVIMSYYQGGMTCEFVAATWGFDAILRLLDAYKAGSDTRVAVREAIGLECEVFDARFRAFLERRYGRYAWRPPPSIEQRQALLAEVSERPWDVGARGALAWAYALHGKATDAEAQAGLALKQAEAAAKTWGGLAALEQPTAEGEVARAAGLRAGAGDAHLALAVVAHRRGRVGPAMRHATRALRLGTRDPVTAHRIRAEGYRVRKDAPRALRELEAVVRLSPPSADLHRMLHGFRKATGDAAGAMAELKRVCELDSNDAAARVSYAEWARDQGRWDEVAEVLNDVNLIDPFLPEAHLLLGEALRRTGQSDEALHRAILEYEVALDLNVPYATQPKFGIAAALTALGEDPERAKAVLAEALAEDPDHEEARALAKELGLPLGPGAPPPPKAPAPEAPEEAPAPQPPEEAPAPRGR